MATLHITEFQSLQSDGNNLSAQAPSPATSSQVVTFTTTTQSAAFATTTRLIRVIASADCYLEFGSNPTATTASMKLLANSVEYFGVAPASKVAAVA